MASIHTACATRFVAIRSIDETTTKSGESFMQMPTRSLVARAVALSLAAPLCQSAFAAAAQEPIEELAEVVVTAQFREQNLQDTPIAITAVTGEMLEQRNQTSIYQVTAQAPNVVLAPMGQANGPTLVAFIRGVGQTDFNYAVEPGVGIYVDDVYFPTLTGSIVDLTDIGRVEVLRGPQGTLSGRNSLGGAIKVFSRTPQGGDEGSVALTYGDYNRIDLRGVGDFTLVEDKLYMRAAGVAKRRDGYMDILDYRCAHPTSPLPSMNVGTGCKLGTLGGVSYTGGRVSLRWVASDAVEVNLIGDVTGDHSEATPSLLVRSVGTQSATGPLPPTDTRYVGYRNPNNPNMATNVLVPLDCRFVPYEVNFLPGQQSCDTISDPYVTYATFTDTNTPTNQMPFKPSVIQPIQTLNQWGLSAAVDWKINDNNAIKWISSFRKYDSSFAQDVDGSPLASQQLLQTLNHQAWTQELRWSGQALNDLLDFTLGGFYYKQKGTLEARVDLPYSGLDFIHGPDRTPANSKAAFLHTEWHLTPALSLIGGVRWTEDYKNYIYKRRNVDLTLPTACAGAPFAPTTNPNCLLVNLYDVAPDDPYNKDRIDWRAGVSYKFTESFMGYAQASTGYKGGGVNPRPFYPAQILSFSPEELTTYEVGAKTDLLGNRLRVNGALFFNKYKNIILNLSNCTAQAGAGFGIPCALPSNVGSADVKGAELELNWRIAGGFSLDASGSVLDFKYKDTGVSTGITLNMITPMTPEQKFSLGLMWEGDIGGAGSLVLRGDASYQSQVHSAAINLPTTRVPGYTVVNARATWRARDTKWEASLEVNNLLDKLYFFGAADWSTSAGSSTYTPALPRNLAVTLKRNF
jgi:iron complex outermembrane receptor protein